MKQEDILYETCGCSSAGRAQPSQGWGREFEPHYPLKKVLNVLGIYLIISEIIRNFAKD